MIETTTEAPLTVVRKRGRPKKSDIQAAKKPGNGKVGRPLGTNGRIEELKARLMATAGNKVIDKIVQIALNDEHPGQIAALKLCIDRQLPMSIFEKDAKRGSNAITINITGVGNVEASEDSTIDAEDVDYEEQDT